MIGFTNSLAFSMFVPHEGTALWIYILGSIILGFGFIFVLTKVPTRYRRPIVIGITFLLGWFYFLEFFIPGSADTAPARGQLLSAGRQLGLARHNLDALEVGQGGALRADLHDGAARIAMTQREVGLAVASLEKARERLDRLKPGIDRQLALANETAERFASGHRLNDRMLERDGDDGKGAIVNGRTSTLKKRLSDIESASGQIGEILTALENAQSMLRGNPAGSVLKVRATVSQAAETTTLARTSISDNFLTPYKEPVANMTLVISAFALGLGIYSLMSIHGKTIAKKRPGWYNSLAFYIALVAMIVFGFVQTYGAAGSRARELGTSVFNILFMGALAQLQATMFALVAFYIVSAAYRAFRIKSGETVLMMAAAFLVMLGFVPVGMLLGLGPIKEWIMTIPNAAAQRGMAFGIGVGGLAMAIRLWLSLERGSYFDKQM